MATGAKAIRLETLAVNDISARIPDNLGVQPKGEKVVVNGPENYPTTLPTSITDTWKGAGIPTELSTDAGRYVCNATFFALQDAANKAKNNELNWLTKSGFIHIPPTDIVPIETSAEAVELAALESMSK